MVITYKHLGNIVFPIFKLPSDNWSEQDGLVYLDGQLLDDRNMEGETLGLRRLQSPFRDFMEIQKSLVDIVGLLKQPPASYIDNKGRLFTYQKTFFAQVKYYKIKRIEGREIASILWLRGINFPFRLPRPPLPENTWAGVLHVQGIPWIIYEFAESKKDATRRKI